MEMTITAENQLRPDGQRTQLSARQWTDPNSRFLRGGTTRVIKMETSHDSGYCGRPGNCYHPGNPVQNNRLYSRNLCANTTQTKGDKGWDGAVPLGYTKKDGKAGGGTCHGCRAICLTKPKVAGSTPEITADLNNDICPLIEVPDNTWHERQTPYYYKQGTNANSPFPDSIVNNLTFSHCIRNNGDSCGTGNLPTTEGQVGTQEECEDYMKKKAAGTSPGVFDFITFRKFIKDGQSNTECKSFLVADQQNDNPNKLYPLYPDLPPEVGDLADGAAVAAFNDFNREGIDTPVGQGAFFYQGFLTQVQSLSNFLGSDESLTNSKTKGIGLISSGPHGPPNSIFSSAGGEETIKWSALARTKFVQSTLNRVEENKGLPLTHIPPTSDGDYSGTAPHYQPKGSAETQDHFPARVLSARRGGAFGSQDGPQYYPVNTLCDYPNDAILTYEQASATIAKDGVEPNEDLLLNYCFSPETNKDMLQVGFDSAPKALSVIKDSSKTDPKNICIDFFSKNLARKKMYDTRASQYCDAVLEANKDNPTFDYKRTGCQCILDRSGAHPEYGQGLKVQLNAISQGAHCVWTPCPGNSDEVFNLNLFADKDEACAEMPECLSLMYLIDNEVGDYGDIVQNTKCAGSKCPQCEDGLVCDERGSTNYACVPNCKTAGCPSGLICGNDGICNRPTPPSTTKTKTNATTIIIIVVVTVFLISILGIWWIKG